MYNPIAESINAALSLLTRKRILFVIGSLLMLSADAKKRVDLIAVGRHTNGAFNDAEAVMARCCLETMRALSLEGSCEQVESLLPAGELERFRIKAISCVFKELGKSPSFGAFVDALGYDGDACAASHGPT